MKDKCRGAGPWVGALACIGLLAFAWGMAGAAPPPTSPAASLTRPAVENMNRIIGYLGPPIVHLPPPPPPPPPSAP